MVIKSSLFLSTVIIIMDVSIKNDIATSISHVHLTYQMKEEDNSLT